MIKQDAPSQLLTVLKLDLLKDSFCSAQIDWKNSMSDTGAKALQFLYTEGK